MGTAHPSRPHPGRHRPGRHDPSRHHLDPTARQVHSNKFAAPEAEYPSIAFQYDLSPISIVVQQTRMPAYQFLTSSCAIIGGVFTVIGLLENLIHVTQQQFTKKQI